MHDTALKRKSTGATTPIGYIVGPDQTYEIDPDTAPHIVRAFEMFLEDSSFADISRYFTANGIRTSRGNPVNGNAVRNILTSRRYIGEYKWSDVVIEGGMPAIVPEDLFYMVQNKIDKCTGKGCDAPNIPARQLESYIASEVADALRDPDALDMISEKLCAYQMQMQEPSPASEDPEKRLAKVEKQLDALVYNLSQRPGSDALLHRLDELEAEREDLRAEIAISKGDYKKDPLLDPSALRDGILAFLNGFSFDNEEMTTERIIKGFVRKVVISTEAFSIELNISGTEPLELKDVLEFDQNSDWWSKSTSSRTLYCGPAVVLLIPHSEKK